MTGVRLELRVDDQAVRNGLKALAAAGGNLGQAMADIGAALLKSTQDRFEAQAGPDGEPWAPFASSTLKSMRKSRKPPQLLRDSGRLSNSLAYLADAAGVQVGTNVVYAAIHQFGGEVEIPARQQTAAFRIARHGAATTADGRRVGSKLRFASARDRAKSLHRKNFAVGAHTITIPARPYLGFDDADQAEILTILADALAAAIAGKAAA